MARIFNRLPKRMRLLIINSSDDFYVQGKVIKSDLLQYSYLI